VRQGKGKGSLFWAGLPFREYALIKCLEKKGWGIKKGPKHMLQEERLHQLSNEKPQIKRKNPPVKKREGTSFLIQKPSIKLFPSELYYAHWGKPNQRNSSQRKDKEKGRLTKRGPTCHEGGSALS